MKNIILFSLLLFISLAACTKKDLPIQDSEEPVFFLNCDIDGLTQRIEAGNNNYFMKTNWSLDSNHFYNLSGDLAQELSSSNSNLEISILMNYAFPLNTEVSVDSVLKLGSHLLNDKVLLGNKQSITFKPEKPFETAADYNWFVTDGETDIRTQNEYMYTAEYSVGKTYSVVLNYDDGVGGCVSTHTNVFTAGNRLQTRIIATRDYTSTELRYVFSYPVPYSGSSFTCYWRFWDGSSTSVKKPSKVFNPGTSVVSLTLVDNNTKDSCVSYYQLNATDNAVCDANYAATFEPVSNSNIFATATVLLKDVDGIVYSSRLASQPASSNFELISVRDYKSNANGQPTKSLNFRFNCIVQNGQKQKSITNASGVFAVSYKP